METILTFTILSWSEWYGVPGLELASTLAFLPQLKCYRLYNLVQYLQLCHNQYVMIDMTKNLDQYLQFSYNLEAMTYMTLNLLQHLLFCHNLDVMIYIA